MEGKHHHSMLRSQLSPFSILVAWRIRGGVRTPLPPWPPPAQHHPPTAPPATPPRTATFAASSNPGGGGAGCSRSRRGLSSE